MYQVFIVFLIVFDLSFLINLTVLPPYNLDFQNKDVLHILCACVLNQQSNFKVVHTLKLW